MNVHPARIDPQELLADCKLFTTRRSGPGGQHRNKVETAVVLTHTPTGISAEASERRNQEANRQQAITRLRLRLALEVRTPPGEPSELWQSRATGGRIVVNADHADYPALLAEALDQLVDCQFDATAAADRLQVSTTQLVNLLKKHAPAFAKLNDQRAKRGLRPLK